MKATLGLVHLFLFVIWLLLFTIRHIKPVIQHHIPTVYTYLISHLTTKTNHNNHHKQQQQHHSSNNRSSHHHYHHHDHDCELLLKDNSETKAWRKEAYIRSLHWKQCPKVLRKDWNWYVRSYKSGDLEDYEGYYVILGQGCVTDNMKFQNAMKAAEYMEDQNCSGIIVHVGPEDKVASLRVLTSKIAWWGDTWMPPTASAKMSHTIIFILLPIQRSQMMIHY